MVPDAEAMGQVGDDPRLALSLRALRDLGKAPAPEPTVALAAFLADSAGALGGQRARRHRLAPLMDRIAKLSTAGKVVVIGGGLTLAGAVSATAAWQVTTVFPSGVDSPPVIAPSAAPVTPGDVPTPVDDSSPPDLINPPSHTDGTTSPPTADDTGSKGQGGHAGASGAGAHDGSGSAHEGGSGSAGDGDAASGGSTPGEGTEPPAPGDGTETPPPGDGTETPPPGDGTQPPPPGDGTEPPPPGDGTEPPPPGEGGALGAADGAGDGDAAVLGEAPAAAPPDSAAR